MRISDEQAPPKADGSRKRLTVQGWLAIVLAVMAVLVITGSVIGAVLLGRTAKVSDELVDRIAPARVEAYELQTALVNQETGLRGYVATADEAFLEPYTAGQRTEQHSAELIASLTAGRDQQAADLAAIEEAAEKWRQSYAEPTIKSVTPGQPGTADRAGSERGKQDFDHLRSLFDAQNEHLSRLRDDGRNQLAHIRTVRDVVLSAIVGVFLLTCVALAALLRTLVTRPLQAVRTDVRQVAAGDFQHRIGIQGPADLQDLAGDVESMRMRVVAALDVANERNDTLVRQKAELDTQALELRRSNAELEQFAYVASHDLQEPLRKVASFCQLLDKRYGDKIDERAKQYIDFAVDGAKRMQVLINDLLTFSRVGRVGDAHTSFGLGQVLDKAAANLATAVEDSAARIEKPDQLPQVTGDPTLLTMLWQNLIGNAIKFRRPDAAPHIRITCEPQPAAEDGTWLVAITDNGIGIPEQFAEKVFVIFQRLHGRDAYTGTGIGLALCRKIVEYHGGKIWIDTAHTGGTRFCFTLRATAQADPRPAADIAHEGASA
ncbi:CHASE3 domain-containing protein [Kitasatospora cineracea]|uniref:sensor histidine kinase n=1 Tax=Kitasatospora cineracea TaxID=88074 RepID=UPI0036CF8F01